MSTNLQVFSFDEKEVRMSMIDGKEFFCAKDVCDILGYANATTAIQDNCKKDGVASSYIIDSLGRNQKAIY